MPQLIWSPEGLAEVQRLYCFLAAKNPDAARRPASAIRDEMQIVPDHPDAGRRVDDMDPELQEWPISLGTSGYVALIGRSGTWLWSVRCGTRKRLVISLHRQVWFGFGDPVRARTGPIDFVLRALAAWLLLQQSEFL